MPPSPAPLKTFSRGGMADNACFFRCRHDLPTRSSLTCPGKRRCDGLFQKKVYRTVDAFAANEITYTQREGI